MFSRKNNVSPWALKNGYEFSEETDAFFSEGAMDLDMFRNWSRAENHVCGMYADRPFEMLDLTKGYTGTGGDPKSTRQTVLLLPGATSDLPDFEIVPHRTHSALAFMSLGGVEFNLDEHAHRSSRELIQEFSKHYGLYSGGMLETFKAGVEDPGGVSPDPSVISALCKPRVLKFLARHPKLFIESQNGHLAVHEAVYRYERILSCQERNELLATIAEFLDLLQQSDYEEPIRGLNVQQVPISKKRLIGTFIGAAIGGFLGFFTAGALALFLHPNLVILAPVVAFLGLAAGGLIANMSLRATD